MKRPILVVMAAGMGSRYGGLKQIDPVGGHGEAILDYTLFDARRAGFETVVFIIKHEIEEAFKATVGARVAKSGMEIRYAFQQLEKLPAAQREAVLLHYFHQFTASEIARVTNTPLPTVKSRLRAARNTLSDKLREDFE